MHLNICNLLCFGHVAETLCSNVNMIICSAQQAKSTDSPLAVWCIRCCNWVAYCFISLAMFSPSEVLDVFCCSSKLSPNLPWKASCCDDKQPNALNSGWTGRPHSWCPGNGKEMQFDYLLSSHSVMVWLPFAFTIIYSKVGRNRPYVICN